MTKLSTLSKVTTKSKKRVGRGYGSGAGGHTTGRGNKGEKIRTKVRLTNDGTKIKKSWLKRLPFLRGKSRVKTYKADKYIIDLKLINSKLKDKDIIDLKVISKLLNITKEDLVKRGVKILSTIKAINKAFTIDKGIDISKGVEKKVIKAGGKIN